ncbi:MAG TPA: sigma-70 family RNA polymerase sigma factor, partial [Terriglobales bacterium]
MPCQGGPQVVCDEILVQAAMSGDARSFETLSERYRQQLFCVAQRITRSREDAEDAVQDALLRAFVHMGDFEGRSNFGTWITSITVNSALMILRKKRGSQETAIGGNNEFGSDNLCCQIADRAPNPETCCAQNETERILRIAGLGENLKVVVEIHLQGRSIRETAEALG